MFARRGGLEGIPITEKARATARARFWHGRLDRVILSMRAAECAVERKREGPRGLREKNLQGRGLAAGDKGEAGRRRGETAAPKGGRDSGGCGSAQIRHDRQHEMRAAHICAESGEVFSTHGSAVLFKAETTLSS